MPGLLAWGEEQIFLEYIINITLLQILKSVSQVKKKTKTTIHSADSDISEKYYIFN